MGNRGELLLSQYTGSKSLSFLCTLTSLSIDQINFIACQFAAVLLSFILKGYVKDPKTRLTYCMVTGVFICNFCFGIQIVHVIIPAALSYLVICKSQSNYMPWQVFSVAMVYLSWTHIRRQFFGYSSGYSLDITGPMMVLTEKVTSMAFAVNDGKRKKKGTKISELEEQYVITEIPNALEYWSYIFQFQSILAGPLVFFNDYRRFIFDDQSPNSAKVVLQKLCGSLFFALLYLKIAPMYNGDYMREDDFLHGTSFVYKIWFILLATSLERTKYYHAWILSDAVCNASGLGYNSATGAWDMVTNVDAVAFEKGANLKETLDVWNIGTMKWLRYVMYERVSPRYKTLATYTTSAVWHGFYPGYYMTFFAGALFTFAARIIRRTLRPLVVNDASAKFSYDILTWLTTRIVIAYASFTFVLLDFTPSLKLYLKLYFFLHVLAISAAVFFPKIVRKPRRDCSNVNEAAAGRETSIMSNPLNDYIQKSTIEKLVANDFDMSNLKTG